MGRLRLSPEQVAERFFMDVNSARKKQQNILVTTLKKKFHYKYLNEGARSEIKELLKSRGLTITPDLDAVKPNQRVTIALTTPPPPPPAPPPEVEPPPDTWFERLLTRQFQSETEVVVWFILPLLEQLGYVQDDLALSYSVKIQQGRKITTKEADVVAFTGSDHDEKSALLVVEAKKPYLPLGAEVLNQARSYAIELKAPYYMATDGKELKLRLLQLFGADNELISCLATELKDKWDMLYAHISKEGAASYKKKIMSEHT